MDLQALFIILTRSVRFWTLQIVRHRTPDVRKRTIHRRNTLSKPTRILIVDDDIDILTAGKLLLKKHFSEVVTCNEPEQIPDIMVKGSFDAILLDMNFSPGESTGEQGFNWLKKILELDSDAVVVMITAHGGVDIAVEAMKHGATDFISKPWQNEKVIATLSSAVQLHESRSEATSLKRSNQALVEASSKSKQNILGDSRAMAKVHSIISRTAPTDANVLILGENGTGKELVARELHHQSLRADNIFMSIDMGSVSENLFESELFGHQKGAFTGAAKDRVGRLVAANGGTLFLDEIGNIPLHLQAKLLTVLEQRKVTPLGSNKSIPIDVRVIAATNVTRDQLASEERFRQDLLFRLNTVEINLPPLRERKEDILEIAHHYAEQYAKKYRKEQKPFSKEAIQIIQNYEWPGNVRALRHAIERAVILSEKEDFQPEDFQISASIPVSESHHQLDGDKETHSISMNKNEDLNLERMEQRMLETALKKHGYNISKAAKELGLTRASLYRRMEKYGF